MHFFNVFTLFFKNYICVKMECLHLIFKKADEIALDKTEIFSNFVHCWISVNFTHTQKKAVLDHFRKQFLLGTMNC